MGLCLDLGGGKFSLFPERHWVKKIVGSTFRDGALIFLRIASFCTYFFVAVQP